MAIQIAVAQLFTEDNTLGDNMLEKCANVCRINIFQSYLLDMLPKMSLSHHNTLYLKQPLLKATRFIPLRQLQLLVGIIEMILSTVFIAGMWIRQQLTLQHLVNGVLVSFACP